MLDMRRGEEELARQTLENLASGIDADISRNIELYDLSLRAVASNLVMPEIKDVSKEIRHLILFDHAATAKHFGVIQVFDAQGKLTIDAASLDPGRKIAATRNISRSIATIPTWACTSAARCCIAAPIRSCSAGASPTMTAAFLASSSARSASAISTTCSAGCTLDPGDTITVLRRDRTDHHANAVRPRHHRQEFGGPARAGAPRNLKEGAAYAGVGPVDPTPRLYVRRGSTKSVLCRGRKAAGDAS